MAARRTAVSARTGAAAGVTGLLAAALLTGGGTATAQEYPPIVPASPSASPSPSGGVGGIGGADPSPSATTASPTPSGPPPVPCLQIPEVRLDRDTMLAGSATAMTVTATPNSIIDVFAYTQPSRTYRVVRRDIEVGNDGLARFLIAAPANTRLYAQQRGCPAGLSKVLNVRTTLSLTVTRQGPRTYTFMGDSLPARAGGLIVSIYRVRPDGGQILSSQARASAVDGEWSLVRRFTGTGRFGFVVRTGQDIMNAPGTSNIRSLLIF